MKINLARPVRQCTGWFKATCPHCTWQTETMTSTGARLVRWMHRRRVHR